MHFVKHASAQLFPTNPTPLPQKDVLLSREPLGCARSWVNIFHGAVYINNLIKTKNCRIPGLMCDIMIYQWQHRKMGGEEVLVDLFIVQSVHVKALCSILAPSHSVKV